jgi:hypothetical protein
MECCNGGRRAARHSIQFIAPSFPQLPRFHENQHSNTPPLQRPNTPPVATVHLIASLKSWIEGEAVRQLYATAKLEGVRLAGVVARRGKHAANLGCLSPELLHDVAIPRDTGGLIQPALSSNITTDGARWRATAASTWSKLPSNLE